MSYAESKSGKQLISPVCQTSFSVTDILIFMSGNFSERESKRGEKKLIPVFGNDSENDSLTPSKKFECYSYKVVSPIHIACVGISYGCL